MIRRLLAVAAMALVAAPVWAQTPLAPTPQPAPPARRSQPAKPAPAPPAAPQPAQTPAPAVAPAPSAPADLPQNRREGQPVNVRVDVTITEQQGTGAPTKKTVSLVVADGENGYARSQAQVVRNVVGEQQLPLNVDAQPRIIDANRIRLRLVVNWRVMAQDATQQEGRPPVFTQITQQIAPVLESGKPLVVAQSADPVTDRQVTVEAKATILR